MRIIVLALALLPAAATASDGEKTAATAPAANPQCQNAKAQLVKKPVPGARPRSLEQQPMANQYLGVLRLENGCDVPVKIREDVGREQR
jgi:hypothetical protein